MASKIRFFALLLLSALFVTGQADLFDVEEESTVYGRALNISGIVDSLLPQIREYLVSEGLDPLRLNDIRESLQGVIIGGKYIELTNGQLQGLSEIARTGDALVVANEDDTYTLDVTFGFSVLDANFDYLYKCLLIARRGQLNGHLNNIDIKVIADASLEERKVVVRAVNIVRLDNMNITLKGHKIDAILNAIIKRITTKFRNTIIRLVEKKAVEAAQKYLNKLIEDISKSDQFMLDNDVLLSAPTSYNILQI